MSNYTRNDLVETSLRLLDEFGLPDLSMRRLASALEVQPSALYWHVPNKQTLLALVADQIIGRAAVVDHQKFISDGVLNWKSLVLSEARAIRDGLLAYRDGAEVVSSTLALGLGAGEALVRIRFGLDAVCDAETARVTADSILFLVLGQVWHEQQRMQADSFGAVASSVESKPEDAANVLETSVDFGVELILEGLERKLAFNHGSR